MEQRQTGKVAIVTGSGQGIGKAVALRLANEGADVVVADINAATARQTAQKIQAIKRRALAYPINVANIAEIRSMVHRVVAKFSRIDILVNAAGVAQTGDFLDLTEPQWERIIDTNLRGTTFCIQIVGKQMIKQAVGTTQTPKNVPGSPVDELTKAGCPDCSCGKIVNLSSISGRRGRALQAAYAASKAAIISITQSAALAFAPYNINVNAVAPGVVPTPMWQQIARDHSRISTLAPEESIKSFIEQIPLKRAGSVDDIAGVVAFLCSSEADYITGQTLNVDGGFEMD